MLHKYMWETEKTISYPSLVLVFQVSLFSVFEFLKKKMQCRFVNIKKIKIIFHTQKYQMHSHIKKKIKST